MFAMLSMAKFPDSHHPLSSKYLDPHSAAGAGAAYPGQAGYAVAPNAGTAGTYGTQRTGYDQAYQQAAAGQGSYASKFTLPEGHRVHSVFACVP